MPLHSFCEHSPTLSKLYYQVSNIRLKPYPAGHFLSISIDRLSGRKQELHMWQLFLKVFEHISPSLAFIPESMQEDHLDSLDCKELSNVPMPCVESPHGSS